MHRFIELLAVVISGVVVLACAGGAASAGSDQPATAPGYIAGQFVEQEPNGKVLVSCRGIGDDFRSAVEHLRLGCLTWYAREQIAQDATQRKAVDGVAEKLPALVDRLVGPLASGARSARATGIKSRRRLPDNRISVEAIVRLDDRAIRRALADVGL